MLSENHPPAASLTIMTNDITWKTWLPSMHVARMMALLWGGAMVYAVVVALVLHHFPLENWQLGTEWVAINGLVLGTLLVFRNKEAYERWWEARKLWGQLVNDTRNLAIKVKAYVDATDEERREFTMLVSAFPYALRNHLRGDYDITCIPGFEKSGMTVPHTPVYITDRVFEMIALWNREDRLNDALWPIDSHARALMDVCGACERIRSSPIPFSYRVLLRHGISLYLVFAPWSICLENGYLGIPVLAVVFYFLLGIEFIAEDVEEPFGRDRDDLPLDDLCGKIRASVDDVMSRSR